MAVIESDPRRFGVVAVGGTFDNFHRGHEVLISKAFEVGDRVIIGVTSGPFAARLAKKIDQSYDERVGILRKFIVANFPGREYEIHGLDDYFGPAVINGEVQAIVVTGETRARVKIANADRGKRGFRPLETVLVDFVTAQDGKPLSSTRIRAGEIDREGRVLK